MTSTTTVEVAARRSSYANDEVNGKRDGGRERENLGKIARRDDGEDFVSSRRLCEANAL